jgi:hypothetical protein
MEPKNTTESEGILPAAVVNKPAVQTEVAVIDTIPVKTDRYGLRVGIDLFRLTRAFYDKGYRTRISRGLSIDKNIS